MTPRPPAGSGRLFVVLTSRRAFEAFVGPLPARFEPLFRFAKPSQTIRLQALLPHARLVIATSYLPPAIHRWIFAARRMSIPTLLLVDGPLEWSNTYHSPSLRRRMGPLQVGLFEPILHDAVAGIGSAQVRWIEHKNEGRGVEFMTYANRRIQTTSPQRLEEGSAREPELDFLVTTARKPYFDEAERRELTQQLAALVRALVAAGHPHALRIFDKTLLRDLREALAGIALRVEVDGDFASALARTRCVVGTPSSVLLEAMQADKPTGTLMFRDSPLFYQTGWLLGCTSDWEPSLRSMFERDPRRLELQRQVLRENLSEQDFFEHCEQILAGERLTQPRPIDAADLELENRSLRRLLGWRARLLAPLTRRLGRGIGRNG